MEAVYNVEFNSIIGSPKGLTIGNEYTFLQLVCAAIESPRFLCIQERGDLGQRGG
jgi:hypothetical protein